MNSKAIDIRTFFLTCIDVGASLGVSVARLRDLGHAPPGVARERGALRAGLRAGLRAQGDRGSCKGDILQPPQINGSRIRMQNLFAHNRGRCDLGCLLFDALPPRTTREARNKLLKEFMLISFYQKSIISLDSLMDSVNNSRSRV